MAPIPRYTKYEPSYIGNNVEIGDGTIISSFAFIGDDSKIGTDCKIKPFVFIAEKTIIGDECFISPHVNILNDKKPPSKGKHWAPVMLGNFVSIGGGATIVPGVTIGDGAKIRAGALVTRNVKAGKYYRGEGKTCEGCRGL